MALDGIIYVNDHPAPRNAGKGSPLTVDEADDNFFELYTRLKALETSPPTAVGISNISVIGSQMLVTMTDATTFGPFTLPIAKLNFAGDYTPGSTYHALDLIDTQGLGLYMVLMDVTDADDPFDPNKVDGSGNPYFNLVFGENVYIYDVGFFYPGKPGQGIDSDGYMAAHQFARPVVLPVNCPGSTANLRIATTAALSFPLFYNGAALGTVDFAIGATVGTFTTSAEQAMATNDIVALGPAVAMDATAKDLTITLLFTRTF